MFAKTRMNKKNLAALAMLVRAGNEISQDVTVLTGCSVNNPGRYRSMTLVQWSY